MCIGSSSSFFSTFLLALVCFIGIWNYSKIKSYISNNISKHISKKSNINTRSENGYSVSEWAVARGEEPPQSFLELLLESNAPLDGGDADPDLSLLGFLIQNNHYHAALLVVEHGGEITDWVIDTMIKQGMKGREDALEAITAFIRSVGKRAQESLNTRHQVEIGKKLSEESNAAFDDPLVMLSPRFWPPIFPERQPLVVLDVVSKELESTVVFEAGEIEEYLNVDKDYVNRNVLDSGKDEKILERINNPNRRARIPFFEYSQISDKAMTCSWNEKIANNQDVLKKGEWEEKISVNEYKYLLARCAVAVVPSFLEIARKKTNVMVRVMQPVADVRLAIIMAKQSNCNINMTASLTLLHLNRRSLLLQRLKNSQTVCSNSHCNRVQLSRLTLNAK